ILTIYIFCFFVTATSPPEIHTLSLHDALPISGRRAHAGEFRCPTGQHTCSHQHKLRAVRTGSGAAQGKTKRSRGRCSARSTFARSEEHTSELLSLRHLVCRLLLEKKKIATFIL